jgi:outer membrane protein OmpA-like peptidoglycan-associated protein
VAAISACAGEYVNAGITNARITEGRGCAFVLGAALALAACASAPRQNAALDTARVQVSAAEADPNVLKYDPADLAIARTDLDRAEAAATRRKDAEIAQPAYLAAQTARLAQARAAARADDARIVQGRAEQDRIRLAETRAREANAARLEREQAAQQARAARQAAQLQADIEDLRATKTDRGLMLTLDDTLFDAGRASLNRRANPELDRLAGFLDEHPDRRAEIEGFTDNVGSDAHNQDLSERRAESVKAALVNRGIDPGRIATAGYGKEYPVASNSDSGGRQLNRRVEVVIGNGHATVAPRPSTGA